MNKIDMTRHSPAATKRPKRARTDTIVLHRFAADGNADGVTSFEEAIRFFTEDPEGLATVLLPGSYLSKRHVFDGWRRNGVPAEYAGIPVRGHGFVPYHFLVTPQGVAARLLPIDARGAHAGRWNGRSIGVAVLGNPDRERPSDAQVAGAASLLGDVLRTFPDARILTHDETIAIDAGAQKGCVGRYFPTDHVKRLAELLAGGAT